MRFEHRPAGFLGLQKEWVIFTGEKQMDVTARPNTTNTNDFDRRILKSKAVEQLTRSACNDFRYCSSGPVGLLEIPDVSLEMEEDRRVVLNLTSSIHKRRELRNDGLRSLRAGLLLLLGQSG